MNTHEFYINRCIQLAKNGLGNTYPNPMVGCVIVCNNKIIGEGWHQKAGEAHAEVNAINSVSDKSLLSSATLFVSLEPCSHFGKTPPCSDLIIKHKIPTVVIGTIDPHSKVAGNGCKKLIENGVKVTVGVLEEECNNLNKRFFTFHLKKRPYVILKWAESHDGFIAPLTKDKQEPVWISNTFSRQLVHKWRSEEQAILVGTTTVLVDNPKLDTRDWHGKNPIRIILDKSGKINEHFQVKNQNTKTIVFTEVENLISNQNLIYENVIFDKHLPERIVEVLYNYQIHSLIIEGGRTTLNSFINSNLWDEARVFIGNKTIKEGIKSPIFRKKISKSEKIQDNTLNYFINHD